MQLRFFPVCRVDAGVVGHGQLTDINDKIFRAQTIQSHDAIEFCTSLVDLYFVFGGFNTAALFVIAVTFLCGMTTFILGFGKNNIGIQRLFMRARP